VGNSSIKSNRCKVFFWLKSESYFIGKSFHLLYTRRKEHMSTHLSRSLDVFMRFATFQVDELEYLGDYMFVPRILSYLKHSPGRCACFLLATFLLLSNVFLAACSPSFSFGGSQGSSTATATPSEMALAQLHWCGRPSMLFRDEGAVTPTAPSKTVVTPGLTATATVGSTETPTATVAPGTPRTITDWSEVESGLGFTVYLPATLPRGTCLVNAQATIHDPIIGGSFTIGYLLPDHSALSLSEAPRISQNTAFQCNPSSSKTPQANNTPKAGTPIVSPSTTQEVPVLLCSGAKGTTNVVMSARGSSDRLQQIFQNLQRNISWMPAS
jgi:hypothetical protein